MHDHENLSNRFREKLESFLKDRKDLNEHILSISHRGIKRFFSLDHQAYEEGALDTKTKELLGLVASMVLRCNECIDYHIIRCVDVGWSDEELYDAFFIALLVGGSIVIPHFRHAMGTLLVCREEHERKGTLEHFLNPGK